MSPRRSGCQVAFATNHAAAVSLCPGCPQKQEACSLSSRSSSLNQHGKQSPLQPAQNIQEAGHAVRMRQHSTLSLLRYKLHRSVVTWAGANCSPKLSLYSTHQHRPILQSSFICFTRPIRGIAPQQRALTPPDTVLTPYLIPAGTRGCWGAPIAVHLIAAGDAHSE